MNTPHTYTFPEQLVQAVADVLSMLPARQSRGLLNQIESLCVEQDQARTKAAGDAVREEIRKELKADLDQKLGDKVHTSAPVAPLPTISEPAQT